MINKYQELIEQAKESGLSVRVTITAEYELMPQKSQNDDWGGRLRHIKPQAPKGVQPMPLLTSFIEKAMSEAEYQNFADGSFYAQIPACPGVWANEETREECERDLREALEMWLLLKLRDNDTLPVMSEIDLNSIVELGEFE